MPQLRSVGAVAGAYGHHVCEQISELYKQTWQKITWRRCHRRQSRGCLCDVAGALGGTIDSAAGYPCSTGNLNIFVRAQTQLDALARQDQMMAIVADCKCDDLMAVKHPLCRLLLSYNNGMKLACAALRCGNQLLESAAKDATGIQISNSLGDISRACICNGCLGP